MADESFANEVYNMPYAKLAIGLLIFILFKNSADPHGQDLKPHGLSFFRCHFPSRIIPTITNP